MYHAMMAARPLTPKKSSSGMHERMKMYFISLPFQPQVLNFRANMGISAIRSQPLMKVPIERDREVEN